MATNPNWPLTVTSVAFNADPFDSAATPTFVDISSRVREFEAQVGRQYELDTMQAGEATLTVSDRDESFNPTNPSSPYYPNVLPYRQIADQAMWPPTPQGAAVNLLNTTAAFDPTFETYTVGAAVSWATAVGGTSPVISATFAQQGTQSLSWSVAGTTTVQGVKWGTNTIPGQQYTASVYVRQTSASTQRIQILTALGASSTTATGTSTTTTGAFVRLTCTFTATQPAHVIQVATTGTAVAGSVYLDAVQLEPGASASAFASTGPVVYGNFGGFVERWPRSWNHQGMYGEAQITAVDGMAILAGQNLRTELPNAILAKSPDYYWPLSEPGGATNFAEASGNQGPTLIKGDSINGPAPTFAAGTATGTPGDPGGTGLKIDTGGISTSTMGSSVIQTGLTPNSLPISWGGTPPFGLSIVWVMNHSPSAVTNGEGAIFITGHDGSGVSVTLAQPGGIKKFLYDAAYNGPHSDASFLVADTWSDNAPHLYVFTLSATTTTLTTTAWVDGTQVGTTSTAQVWSSPLFLTSIMIGGSAPGDVGFAAVPNGIYSHLSLWNRQLSNTEIADLTSAFRGYPSENSGNRVARYLGYNWIGPTAVDTGQSTLGVSDLAANTTVLDAVQSVALSEGGQTFVDANGAVTFQSRTSRFLNTTAKWSMGEAESPYEPDIAYDFDPTLIYNDPEITRSGGSLAIGGTLAARQASWKRYGKRSYTITVNLATDLETQDRANWIFFTHKDPQQRISTLTLRPSANPSLWPVCLGLRVSDRVTVKRRTSAGYTMSGDYFIERIERRRVSSEWTFSLQMSPATATGQPWILGDSTYGLLGSSTVLGY